MRRWKMPVIGFERIGANRPPRELQSRMRLWWCVAVWDYYAPENQKAPSGPDRAFCCNAVSLVAGRIRSSGVRAAGVRNLVDLGYGDRGVAAAAGRTGSGLRSGAGCTRGAGSAGVLRVAHGSAHANFLTDVGIQLRAIGARRQLKVIRGSRLVDDGELAGGAAEASFNAVARSRCRGILARGRRRLTHRAR
jgi:hypothetical protein